MEALLVRRAIAVCGANSGRFDASAVLADYVTFMTTPDTHNDTYCGTCHRMFFENRSKGLPLDRCPSNDGQCSAAPLLRWSAGPVGALLIHRPVWG